MIWRQIIAQTVATARAIQPEGLTPLSVRLRTKAHKSKQQSKLSKKAI
jgi:hypothetical protein